MTVTMPHQKPVNRVAYALDSSGSMSQHQRRLVEVMDTAIAELKRETEELGQITRVSIYTFDDEPRCIVSDMDVLHLPSIRDIYRIGNMTDLLGAVHLGLDDLEMFPTKYGRHANLFYVLTDGQHNPANRWDYTNRSQRPLLNERLAALSENWTVAALVPNVLGVGAAKRYGFPPGNIAQWDAMSATGLAEAGATLTGATSTYLRGRASGVEGTRTLFATDATAVNDVTVKKAAIPVLDPSCYQIKMVERTPGADVVIRTRAFADQHFGGYKTGHFMYFLSKPETIQGDKRLAVRRKKTGEVFMGDGVRDLVGLPLVTAKIKPGFNTEYEIFVQSKSSQRQLVPGTPALWLN